VPPSLIYSKARCRLESPADYQIEELARPDEGSIFGGTFAIGEKQFP
jgi:hypothetical protein